MLYTNILEYLREIYPSRRYSAVLKVLDSVDKLDETTVLIDQIESYVNETLVTQESIEFSEIDTIITDYVIPEIVNKLCGINVVGSVTTIYFLAGLLEFHVNITKYDPGITATLNDILATDELDPISKLGDIVNTYQSDFYPLDAHHIVEHIPNEIITKYKTGIEDTMRSIETDADQISALYELMGGVSPELLTSELLNYIIRYDAYDISESPALAHIMALITENRISQVGLGVEFAVFAVMFHKDAEDMSDIIMLLCEEFDTNYLLTYIKTTLSDTPVRDHEYS